MMCRLLILYLGILLFLPLANGWNMTTPFDWITVNTPNVTTNTIDTINTTNTTDTTNITNTTATTMDAKVSCNR